MGFGFGMSGDGAVGDQEVGDLLYLRQDGSKTYSGDLTPSDAGVRSLGSASLDNLRVYTRFLTPGTAQALVLEDAFGNDVITIADTGDITLVPIGDLLFGADTDRSTILGRTRIDSRGSDEMHISHFDLTSSTNVALRQTALGFTVLNAASGQSLSMRVGNAEKMSFSSAGLTINDSGSASVDVRVEGDTDTVLLTTDAGLDRVGVGVALGAHLGKLHVDQLNLSAAIPVLVLDQADVSEEMIEFITTIGIGNAIEAIGIKTLTTTHFIKVTIPGGLTRYIPVGTIA